MGLMASIKGPASRPGTVVTVRLPQSVCRRVPSGFFLTLSSGLVRMRRMGAPVPCLRIRGGRLFDKGLTCTMARRQFWPKTPGDVGQTCAAATAPLRGARAELQCWEKQP